MTKTQLTAVVFGVVAMCTAGLTAQTQESQTTTKTKTEIKGGKSVTATAADVISTRTPVAYAPPWASTSASNM